jgi:hypothetical protein
VTARGNIHEDLARLKKAMAILERVPCGATAAEIEQVADWLAGLPVADRNVLAADAKALPPSDTTWEMVVKIARARTAL